MLFGGLCHSKSTFLTKLLLFGGLLAFERRSLVLTQQVDEVDDTTAETQEATATCTATSTHFNLVAEAQFGGNQRCIDKDAKCHIWSQAGECIRNPVFMLDTCRTSCRSCLYVTRRYGVEQVVSASTQSDVLEEYMVTQRMHDYMIDVVYQDSFLRTVKDTCLNQDRDCVHWAAIGECEKNPAFMTVYVATWTHVVVLLSMFLRNRQCAPACRTCHMVDYLERCPNATTTLSPSLWTKPGDLNHFFEQLLAKSSTFSLTVHSIPSEFLDAARNVPLVTIAPTAIRLVDGPWVITLEDFLDVTECNHLIHQGHIRGYERSTNVGTMKADGTFHKVESQRRTSTNTWCSGDCFNDSLVQDMTKKLETLLHVPTNYTENWQLLRYEVGQEYKEHHDYVRQQVTRAEGPRILTVFFYLNTVTKGGGTQFPALNNLTIYPERGRVLIWPSVLNESPDEPDARTNHRALPVGEGVKYGANAWIHQRDYKTPQSQFCV